MSNENEIAAIEQNINQAKEAQELGNALQRLFKNADFRKVIKDGYFTDEAVRLVHLRGDPSFKAPDRQALILAQIDAISNLNQYFLTVQQLAGMADKDIEQGNAVLDELREEDIK